MKQVKLVIIVCFPWNWLAQMTTTNRLFDFCGGRYNSLTLQVSRFFKHSSGKRIYKQTINFFLSSITEIT